MPIVYLNENRKAVNREETLRLLIEGTDLTTSLTEVELEQYLNKDIYCTENGITTKYRVEALLMSSVEGKTALAKLQRLTEPLVNTNTMYSSMSDSYLQQPLTNQHVGMPRYGTNGDIDEEEEEIYRELEERNKGEEFSATKIVLKHAFQQDVEMFSHILPYALPGMFYLGEDDLLKYPPAANILKPKRTSYDAAKQILAKGSEKINALQRGFAGDFAEQSKGFLRVIKVKDSQGYKFYKVSLAKENPAQTSGLMPFILSPLQDEDLNFEGKINVYTVEYKDSMHNGDRKTLPKFEGAIMDAKTLKDDNAKLVHNNIHVLFRGTADFSGAWRDAIESHAGKESLINAYPYIKQLLAKTVDAIPTERRPEINLVISGHSLGGADTQNFATALLMGITSGDKLLPTLKGKKRNEADRVEQEIFNNEIKELEKLSCIKKISINHNSTAPVTEDVARSCFSASNAFLSTGGELTVNIICRDGDPVPELGGSRILSSAKDMGELLTNYSGKFNVKMAKITHPQPSFTNPGIAYGAAKAAFNGAIAGSAAAVTGGAAAVAGGLAGGLAETARFAGRTALSAAVDSAMQAHTAKIDTIDGETMVILNPSIHPDDVTTIAETLTPGMLSTAAEAGRQTRNTVFTITGANHSDIAATLELKFFDVQDDETKKRMIPSLPDKIINAAEGDTTRYCDNILDYLLADEGRLITFANSKYGMTALQKVFTDNGVNLTSEKITTLELLALVGNPTQFNAALNSRRQNKAASRKGMVLTFLCLRLANGYTKAAEMITTYISDITISDVSWTGSWSEYTGVRGGPDSLTPIEYIAKSGDLDLLKHLSSVTSKRLLSGGIFNHTFADIFNINQENIISILNKAPGNGIGSTFVKEFLLLENIQPSLKALLSNDDGIKALAKLLATHNIEPNSLNQNKAIIAKLNLQYQVAKNLSNDDYLANINAEETTVDVFIATIMQANTEQLKKISPEILTKKIDERSVANLCMEREDGKIALHKIAQHMKDIPTTVRNKLADVEILSDAGKTEHFSYAFADSPIVMFRKHRTKDSANEATLYQHVSKGDCEAVKEMTTGISEIDVYNIYRTETVLTLAAKQRDYKMFDTLLSLNDGRNVVIANIRKQNRGSNISAPLTCLCANLENNAQREAVKQSIRKFMNNITETNPPGLRESWEGYTDVRGGPDNLTPMEYIARSGDVTLLKYLSEMKSRYGVGITETFADTSHKFVHIFCIDATKAKEILKQVPQDEAGDKFAEEFCKIVNNQLKLSGATEIKLDRTRADIRM